MSPAPKPSTSESNRVLELARLAYDAATDPSRWSIFLEELAGALQGIVPALTVADRRTDVASLYVSPGLSRACDRAYHEHFIHRDPRRPRIKSVAAGGVFVGQALLDDAELLRSEFYNDFLRPNGFFHVAGGIPFKDRDRIAVLRVIRPRRARPFDADDLDLLRALMPHLRTALRIHRQFAAANDRLEATAEILDRFPTGVILLDRAGRVLATNRSAAAILSRADGLTVVRRGLLAASQRDTDALHRVIGEVTSPRAHGTPAAAGGSMRLARPSMRRALNVLVTPRNSAVLTDIEGRAAAVVFVSDPEERIEVPVDALCRHLGLTQAEAALVLALAQGKSLEAAAEERSISVLTART